MEEPSKTSTQAQVNIPPSSNPAKFSNHGLQSELESLRKSYQSLQSEAAAMEESLSLLQHQMDECVNHNARLSKEVDQLTAERNSLEDKVRNFESILTEKEVEFEKKLDEELAQRDGLMKEVEDFKERVKNLESETEERNGLILKCLDSLGLLKDCLSRVIGGLEEEKDDADVKESEGICEKSESGEESRNLLEETRLVARLVTELESEVDKYKELRKKEKKELENSVVSLTEENRDISSLLRIALLEKEALEKKIKGHDKRVPLLQFGLHKVGFGFMMGGGPNEQSTENSAPSSGSKSDGSEFEEEVVSLASTVERIMKNLRLEITQLRKSLDESRSDTERLQVLSEKQAKEITENKLYIKELEDRERVLAQNVEELLVGIKETEEEAARWKQACEWEVETGKKEMGERDKVNTESRHGDLMEKYDLVRDIVIRIHKQLVDALKKELQKTKAALDISNGKLRLKEELASAAMAAQAAAEKSLQLADRRAVELRQRIEELTRQLEEVEKRERNSHKARRVCWPWQIFRFRTSGNIKRMLPEMQALNH